jgi:hypothetical protein
MKKQVEVTFGGYHPPGRYTVDELVGLLRGSEKDAAELGTPYVTLKDYSLITVYLREETDREYAFRTYSEKEEKRRLDAADYMGLRNILTRRFPIDRAADIFKEAFPNDQS